MQTGKQSQSFIQFIARRLLYALLSFVLITMVLYAGVMIVPPEARAELYVPKGKGGARMSENVIPRIIKEHHLDEPYLIQYAYWFRSLLDGTWGYSPTMQEDVLPALLRRTPLTLELGLYSLLLFIPLGLWSGLAAGWKPGRSFDLAFRPLSFFGLSMPPFILAILLLTVLYAKTGWFPPGRLDMLLKLSLDGEAFRAYTGLMTVDSLLNGRMDVFWDAVRHLVLPVFTLSAYHWATLGRIARAMIIGERRKEYLVAAKARGVKESRIVGRHALRSIMAPSLAGIAMSAASIVTGVYVVEVIFSLPGVSTVIVEAMSFEPDAPAILGFAVYSVVIVIALMLVLDVLQVLVDPRVRAEALPA